MKRILIGACFLLCASVSYAGQFYIYSEADLAPKWKASAVGTIEYSQGVAIGLGAEYIDSMSEKFDYVIGGKFQLDRNIIANGADPLYHLHTVYSQILLKLNVPGLSAGIELNYTFHGGDDYYESGASLGGNFGQGFVLVYQKDRFFLKGGYRILNATFESGGVEADIESSGLFIQTGQSF